MQSMLQRCVMLAAALAAAGCNELIGAGSPEVIEDPSSPGTQDPETSGGEGPGVCGDGALAAGEECDDGNTADGDGCSACVMDCGQKPEVKDPDTHHCYRVEEMNAKTWDEAGKWCEAWGGTLAALTLVDEFAFIQSRLRENTWIGGRDPAGSGAFEWITGEPWGFASWSSDRPKADGHATCVLIEKEFLTFMDEPCATPSMFVCERAPAGSM